MPTVQMQYENTIIVVRFFIFVLPYINILVKFWFVELISELCYSLLRHGKYPSRHARAI